MCAVPAAGYLRQRRAFKDWARAQTDHNNYLPQYTASAANDFHGKGLQVYALFVSIISMISTVIDRMTTP